MQVVHLFLVVAPQHPTLSSLLLTLNLLLPQPPPILLTKYQFKHNQLLHLPCLSHQVYRIHLLLLLPQILLKLNQLLPLSLQLPLSPLRPLPMLLSKIQFMSNLL